MIKLILHSLNKRRAQSISTVVSVAVCVAVLFALLLLYSGITAGLESSGKRLGADILVIPAEAETLIDDEELLFTGAPVSIYMDETVLEDIAAVDGVTAVSGQFFGQTLDSGCCSILGATRLIGYDDRSDWLISPWLNDSATLQTGEILLGYGVSDYADQDTYILGKKMTVKGILDETGTSLDRSIIMNMDEVRALTAISRDYNHIWAKYGAPEMLVSAALVQVDEEKKDSVSAGIMAMGGLRTVVADDVLGAIYEQMRMVFSIMLGAGLLLALSSILQLFARFFSLIWDRKGEWGLYRALGASRRDLQALIYGEALTLTLGGTVIGLLLGGGLYEALLAYLRSMQTFPFIAPGATVVCIGAAVALMLFALVALAASSLPARRSGRIDPSAAMALGDID